MWGFPPLLPFSCAGVGSIRQLHGPPEGLLHEHRPQIGASWRSHRTIRVTPARCRESDILPELLSNCPVSEASTGRESRTRASPNQEIDTWNQNR